MADTANTPFSQEEICAQAQGNAAAWILTMIAYLKERGSAVVANLEKLREGARDYAIQKQAFGAKGKEAAMSARQAAAD